MSKRAFRIHHRNRIKNNRKRYWDMDLEKNSRFLGICINTPHPCSCYLCSNRRKHDGPTLQEIKNNAF